MHELRPDRAAINASRLLRELAVDGQIGMRRRTEKAERIEVGFQISPTAIRVEHAVAFPVRCVDYCGRRSLSASLESRHMDATRIMDERHIASDSAACDLIVSVRWTLLLSALDLEV
jgi:hypothetical protein